MTGGTSRRQIIRTAVLASLSGVAGPAARASAGRTRIGVLTIEALSSPLLPLEDFTARLNEIGVAHALSVMSAHGQAARLPALAQEMAGTKPDIIVAVGAPATAALQATDTRIPLVMVAVGNPVGLGFIKSRERPGGTVTGVSDLRADTARQRLVLIKAALPAARRIGYMRSPGVPQLGSLEAAAAEFEQELVFLDVRGPAEIDAAASDLARHQLDALIVIPNPTTFAARHGIAAAARENRLPVLFGWRQFADASGLMCYGADIVQLFEDAADLVQRIAVGKSAGAIPVVDPNMTLVLNRRVATRLRIALSASLLASASVIID
jgi:putative ABC transport system substrate-binding protein